MPIDLSSKVEFKAYGTSQTREFQYQCCQPSRIIRESPEYLSNSHPSTDSRIIPRISIILRISRKSIFSIHNPPNGTKMHILMSIFEKKIPGGMLPDPPSRASRLTPLAIPKPPEFNLHQVGNTAIYSIDIGIRCRWPGGGGLTYEVFFYYRKTFNLFKPIIMWYSLIQNSFEVCTHAHATCWRPASRCHLRPTDVMPVNPTCIPGA